MLAFSHSASKSSCAWGGEANGLEEGVLRGLSAQKLDEAVYAVHRAATGEDEVAVLLAYDAAQDSLSFEATKHVRREDLKIIIKIKQQHNQKQSELKRNLFSKVK